MKSLHRKNEDGSYKEILPEDMDDRGVIALMCAVIENAVTSIRKPNAHFGEDRRGDGMAKKRWLTGLIVWARDPACFWLNQMEAIMEYDRKQVADRIIAKAEKELKLMNEHGFRPTAS